MDKKTRVKKIVTLLKQEYPDSCCTLDYKKPHELVVATILSAQSTDERVNKITPALFKKYKTVTAFAKADLDELMEYIKTAGLYRNKSKSIKNCMTAVANDHKGRIPDSMEELVKLPGIGRKTANVILGTAYGIASGIAVDTHVTRLSQLLGLSKHKEPVKIEKDLMKLIPQKDWIIVSHLLIDHGRNVCIARKPNCGECVLNKLCPSKKI
jgi:endonuclease III